MFKGKHLISIQQYYQRDCCLFLCFNINVKVNTAAAQYMMQFKGGINGALLGNRVCRMCRDRMSTLMHCYMWMKITIPYHWKISIVYCLSTPIYRQVLVNVFLNSSKGTHCLSKVKICILCNFVLWWKQFRNIKCI